MEDYLKGRDMRTVVKDEKSEWREVKIGVPQESISFGTNKVFSTVYINDMTE